MTWVGHLISIAVILQTIEYYWTPFYPGRLIAVELPKILRWTLKFDRFILALRLVAAVIAIFSPTPVEVTLMLATSWLIAIRWRGTFNGGSDIMTFHILGAWLVSLCFPELARACVYYIAIQITLSYFVAGAAKVANPEWRDGSALRIFMKRWAYQLGPAAALALSWFIIIFELLFPIALHAPLPFLAAGILFHLANAYILGFNRFFFVWLAGYPALLVLAQSR